VNLAHWFLPTHGRLSDEDRRLLSRLALALPSHIRVGLLHPARPDVQVSKRFEAISPARWDLRFRSVQRHDVLVAGRLPDFAPGSRRFRAARCSCQLLLTLDAEPEAAGEELRPLGEFALANGRFRAYRGELTDPLLRVDDYPTGVRPILEDLSSLHDVLSQIDAAGLPFHLGIVPALLNEQMIDFLRGLSSLVVSMHGFEHGYAERSQILIQKNDPFNQHGTVSGFDEFAGQDYAEILSKIREGRRILAERLGQPPLSYIPPCNAGNRSTGRALLATGFEYVLSEKAIPGCELPIIRSEFYDRSSAFSADLRPNVASLHATWEADMLRAGDSQSLPRFLASLVEQRARARSRVETLAGELSNALSRG